jgi:ribose 5-phosphate isomerase B
VHIAFGSDHAGRPLRLALQQHLAGTALGHHVVDLGTDTDLSVDYPHYASLVGNAVVNGEAHLGVLVCGTGVGVSMAANRIAGARAAVCTNEFMARMARAHNDANVLCLGGRVLGVGTAISVLEAFLETHFEGGRHARRVEQIAAMEKPR